jgi:hypothetical protein
MPGVIFLQSDQTWKCAGNKIRIRDEMTTRTLGRRKAMGETIICSGSCRFAKLVMGKVTGAFYGSGTRKTIVGIYISRVSQRPIYVSGNIVNQALS